MNPTQVILLVVAVLAVGAAIFFALKAQRTQRLRSRFGPEYNRAIEEAGAMRGEQRLANLEKRVEKYNIHPLAAPDRDRFVSSWRAVQARFVDDPKAALQDGDRLLGEVMAARGYPMADFEQQAADLSVNHGAVVENYRAGHGIAVRQSEASTEDLRQAMVHYRKLFDDLVGEPSSLRTSAATA
jgi:hypothetical protein